MTNYPVFRLVALLTLAIVSPLSSPAQDRARDEARSAPDQTAPGPSAVKVSGKTNGLTPKLIGYNLSVYKPGNNVSPWLRYDEVNAGRSGWAGNAWPTVPARWEVSDNTLARFESERDALRANPAEGLKELTANIIAEHGAPPEGTIGLLHHLSEMKKNGFTNLVQLNHTEKKYPFERADGSPDWHGCWSYWRGVYLLATYLGSTYGVERFQLFNEPDLNKPILQADYLRRHQIGADALQAAFADLNREREQKLSLRLSAPVTAGLLVFEKRSGRSDTRDAETGWGELVTRHRLDDFPGRSKDFKWLYNVYSFQNYGRSPERMLDGLPLLRRLIAAGNDGKELPIIATEFNVATARNFSKTKLTIEDPEYYAPFGAIAAAYVNAGIDELYVFRHTLQPDKEYGFKKNGMHIVGLKDRKQNIVGSTRGAEAARLFSKGFRDARERLSPPALQGDELHAAACIDKTDGAHYLLLTHLGKKPDTIAVDLSDWNLPAGSLVTAEEVSMGHHGDFRQAAPLPADGRLPLSVSASSVTLLTVRPTVSGASFTTHPVSTAEQKGVLSAAPMPEAKKAVRVLLALRAERVTKGGRLQVRGGGDDVVQSEVLGQFVPTKDVPERVIDITRYVLDNPNKPLVFQVVAEGTNAFVTGDVPPPAVVRSAEVRIYDSL